MRARPHAVFWHRQSRKKPVLLALVPKLRGYFRGEWSLEDARRPLSECLAVVDTHRGREQVEAVPAARPFPRYEAASSPGFLVKIDADGTRTTGRFVDREFRPADPPEP